MAHTILVRTRHGKAQELVRLVTLRDHGNLVIVSAQVILHRHLRTRQHVTTDDADMCVGRHTTTQQALDRATADGLHIALLCRLRTGDHHLAAEVSDTLVEQTTDDNHISRIHGPNRLTFVDRFRVVDQHTGISRRMRALNLNQLNALHLLNGRTLADTHIHLTTCQLCQRIQTRLEIGLLPLHKVIEIRSQRSRIESGNENVARCLARGSDDVIRTLHDERPHTGVQHRLLHLVSLQGSHVLLSELLILDLSIRRHYNA